MAEAGPSPSHSAASTPSTSTSQNAGSGHIPEEVPVVNSRIPQQVWQGILQWEGNGPLLVPLNCNIKALKREFHFLNANEWGNNLPLQLVPKLLIGGYGTHFFRESVLVWFNFNDANPNVQMLKEIFSNGAAGIIKTTSPIFNQSQVKVIIMVMSPDTSAFIGFVPYDQAGLISRMGTVAQIYMTSLQNQNGASEDSANQAQQPAVAIQLNESLQGVSGGVIGQQAMDKMVAAAIASASDMADTDGQDGGNENDAGPPPAKRRRVTEENLCSFWRGCLHWLRPRAIDYDDTLYYETLASNVTCYTEDLDLLDCGNWPDELVIQLIQAGYIETLGRQYVKNALSLFVDIGPFFMSERLRVDMDKGNVGIVHLRSSGSAEAHSCNIKVFLLMFSKERQGYVGFVPHEQADFETRVRAVIKEQQRVRRAMLEQREWENLRSALKECNAIADSDDDDDDDNNNNDDDNNDNNGQQEQVAGNGLEDFPLDSPEMSSPSSGFVSEENGEHAGEVSPDAESDEVFSPDVAQD